MPRKKHEWYPGAKLHVIARGNHRNDIFKDNSDYELYLSYLQEAIEYYDNKYIIIAYVLMTNHVHIVIQTKDRDISDLIKRVHSRYAWNFNKKYKYIGHLFQDRYRSELIENDKYLLESSRYVHLNPIRANMVEMPEEYSWSSYSMIIGTVKEKLIDSKIILRYFKKDNSRNLYKLFVESAIKREC
ncbi:transposase [Clostridium sp. JN-9]|uniref:transposase n=1 Tax=Clostridium sp. JN-9 TaxID=2507159 RepID=UPI000FFE0D87|nr:transposase [Clostridium sp. JN-9]QAT41025.1 transposase [Clostridium sp. JN-9]